MKKNIVNSFDISVNMIKNRARKSDLPYDLESVLAKIADKVKVK